jgi:hypothetical protein
VPPTIAPTGTAARVLALERASPDPMADSEGLDKLDPLLDALPSTELLSNELCCELSADVEDPEFEEPGSVPTVGFGLGVTEAVLGGVLVGPASGVVDNVADVGGGDVEGDDGEAGS